MTREQCAGLKPGDKVCVTKGCPDGNPYVATVINAWWNNALCSHKGQSRLIAIDSLHLTADEALAHFEKLRAAAIARVEKKIRTLRTLPDRLSKLRNRQPVIEGKE